MPSRNDPSPRPDSANLDNSIHPELERLVTAYSTQTIVGEFGTRLRTMASINSEVQSRSNAWFFTEASDLCRTYGLELKSYDPANSSIHIVSPDFDYLGGVEFTTHMADSSMRGSTRIKIQGQGEVEFFVAELLSPYRTFPIGEEASNEHRLRQLQAIAYVGVIDSNQLTPETVFAVFDALDPKFRFAQEGAELHLMSALHSEGNHGMSLLTCNLDLTPTATHVQATILGPGEDGQLQQRNLLLHSSDLPHLGSRASLEQITGAAMRGQADELFGLLLQTP